MSEPSDAPIVRPMTDADGPAVLRIYAEGIATGDATFEQVVPDWPSWSAKHLAEPRLVALEDGEILGWAALSAVSARPVYAGVCELSIYIGGQAGGRGVGSRLLAAIVAASEAAGIWTLQAGIFPQNEASLRLHRQHGFVEVGRRRRIGRMTYGRHAGQWRDVIWLERRSTVVGVD